MTVSMMQIWGMFMYVIKYIMQMPMSMHSIQQWYIHLVGMFVMVIMRMGMNVLG
jgi:hypothetical protein